jgi:hypothetical protein
MLLNASFNTILVISWRSVLFLGETEVPGENHRPVASHWQCCIEYTSPWTGFELTTLVMIGSDCTGSCNSNYNTTTTVSNCQIKYKSVSNEYHNEY